MSVVARHIPVVMAVLYRCDFPFAPLLEEEQHASGRALIAERTSPIRMHRACAVAAFAAADDPVDPRGVRETEIDAIED